MKLTRTSSLLLFLLFTTALNAHICFIAEDFLINLRDYNSKVRTQEEYTAFITDNNSAEFYTFKLQVGAYQRKEYRNLNQFNDLEETTEEGMVRYFWGSFDSLIKAEERRQIAVEKGIHDAFIVVYFGDQRVGVLIAPKD